MFPYMLFSLSVRFSIVDDLKRIVDTVVRTQGSNSKSIRSVSGAMNNLHV